jgi:hypothetical protein
MRILLLLLVLPFLALHSQELHHQALSSQGTSKELPKGVYVSQTIGQQFFKTILSNVYTNNNIILDTLLDNTSL